MDRTNLIFYSLLNLFKISTHICRVKLNITQDLIVLELLRVNVISLAAFIGNTPWVFHCLSNNESRAALKSLPDNPNRNVTFFTFDFLDIKLTNPL